MTVAQAQPGGGREHAPVLDAIRGFGSIGVISFHAGGLPGGRLPGSTTLAALHHNLDIGLVMFFALSGYLISAPFVRSVCDGDRRPSIGRYTLRRFCRIFPPYWAALLFVILFIPPAPTDQRGALGLVSWWQVPLHAGLMQNFIGSQYQQLLRVSWSLHDELIFYAAIPLVALFLWRRRTRITPERLAGALLVLWACSVLSMAVADAGTYGSERWAVMRFTFPSIAGFFVPGVLVAVLRTRAAAERGGVWAWFRNLATSRRRSFALAVALVLAGVALSAVPVDAVHSLFVVADLRLVGFAVASGLLISTLLERGSQARAARILGLAGQVSFGVYVWQVVVLRILSDHGWYPGLHGGLLAYPLDVVFVYALTLPLGIASFVLIERPLLNWSARVPLDSLVPRRRAVVVPENAG